MVKEKTSRRKIKAAETKSKIFTCAAQLFQEYGLEKVSVDSIVEKAGISKGAFYIHFDSKNTLLAALITEYVNHSDLDYKIFLESFPPDTAASNIIISLVEKIADNIEYKIGYSLIKIAYTIQMDRTINTNMLLNYDRTIYTIFSDLICRGIKQEEFKPEIPAKAIADHLVIAIRGFTYEWCIRYPNFNYKEQVLKHFAILLSGIKKPGLL